MLEEGDGPNSSASQANNSNIRGPYERAWTTDATRALIHIRGPMEHRFTEGRQKRTALWLHCTRQLQKMGFRYSAGKVQKKWHNILITYNKNLSKKYTSGYVHWEFFEEMFKYLQGKKADFGISGSGGGGGSSSKNHIPPPVASIVEADNNSSFGNAEHMIQPHVEIDSKSNDDFDEEDSTTLSDMKKPKVEMKEEDPHDVYPLEITDSSSFMRNNAKLEQPVDNDFPHHFGNAESATTLSSAWWQDYFERKLQVERDKIELQKEMHRDLMQFNKMSLLQQEKIERIKIEAINNLTGTLQKLVEIKYKKT